MVIFIIRHILILIVAVKILFSFQMKSCVKSMICTEKKAWRMTILAEGIIKAGLISMKNLVSLEYSYCIKKIFLMLCSASRFKH